MSDAYCKTHYIGYCPDLSKVCPYCRIAALSELQRYRVDYFPMDGGTTETTCNLTGEYVRYDELSAILEQTDE